MKRKRNGGIDGSIPEVPERKKSKIQYTREEQRSIIPDPRFSKKPTPGNPVTSKSILGNVVTSTCKSSDNIGILNFIPFTVERQPGEKCTILGSIVNIAADFDFGLDHICVKSVCQNGLGTYNSKRFGAGTLRIHLNLGTNHRSATYDEDVALLLKNNKIGSLEEYMESNENYKNGDPFTRSLRYPTQKQTLLIFDSGRVVSVGASSEWHARQGGALVVKLLNDEMGIPAQFRNFRVVNIVATVNLGFEVDLDKLSEGEGSRVAYDPDLFPAVIIPSEDKTTGLVNKTGNCILTGASNRLALQIFFNNMYHIVLKYRKKNLGELEKEEQEESLKVPTIIDTLVNKETSIVSNKSEDNLCRALLAVKDKILSQSRMVKELGTSVEIDDREVTEYAIGKLSKSTGTHQNEYTKTTQKADAYSRLLNIINSVDTLDDKIDPTSQTPTTHSRGLSLFNIDHVVRSKQDKKRLVEKQNIRSKLSKGVEKYLD